MMIPNFVVMTPELKRYVQDAIVVEADLRQQRDTTTRHYTDRREHLKYLRMEVGTWVIWQCWICENNH